MKAVCLCFCCKTAVDGSATVSVTGLVVIKYGIFQSKSAFCSINFRSALGRSSVKGIRAVYNKALESVLPLYWNFSKKQPTTVVDFVLVVVL